MKNSAARRPEVAKFLRFYLEEIDDLPVKGGYDPPTAQDKTDNRETLAKLLPGWMRRGPFLSPVNGRQGGWDASLGHRGGNSLGRRTSDDRVIDYAGPTPLTPPSQGGKGRGPCQVTQRERDERRDAEQLSVTPGSPSEADLWSGHSRFLAFWEGAVTVGSDHLCGHHGAHDGRDYPGPRGSELRVLLPREGQPSSNSSLGPSSSPTPIRPGSESFP